MSVNLTSSGGQIVKLQSSVLKGGFLLLLQLLLLLTLSVFLIGVEVSHAQLGVKVVVGFDAGLHSAEDLCIHPPIWKRKKKQ